MLSDFDTYGEFAPHDTPMPITRGDLLDLLVAADSDHGRIAVSTRAVCLWSERRCNGQPAESSCDVITFYGGMTGMVTSLDDLAVSWLAGADMIARLDAPYGIALWIRVLKGGQYEHGSGRA